ncbi:MAG TPA: phosphoenolpyruvate--protein phosphotransferase, partial [Thermodesulfobacteriota bacterium]|nr:phosphoenolpyruvate--protein phosphotransferase [Thermodesulfobacteriota bacterium]
SSGIAVGKAFLVDRGDIEFPFYYSLRNQEEVEQEQTMFLEAVEATRNELLETKKDLKKKGYKEAGYIIEAYLMILKDKVLIEEAIKHIQRERMNAAWALRNTLKRLEKVFSEIEDEYLKERKNDIDYVGRRIMQNLTKSKESEISKVQEKVIIVAYDLSPADTTHLDSDKVLAFVTDIGGRTSHTAIMARALEIPAIVGTENASQQIRNGDLLIVDGVSGETIINPTQNILDQYLKKKTRLDDQERESLKYKPLAAETRDGYRVRLLANIEITDELPSVIHYGAEGIGLYRTEFLYLNRSELPNEEDHFNTYREVVEKMAPYPTTIRTFDLGGDKFLSQVTLAEEMNPALGLRAIRFCLKEVDVFKTQLRAILRVSALGKVRVLFPMISGLNELHQARRILEDVKEDLRLDGLPFDPEIEVGIMVEIPSAVVIADLLAQEVDFFSIGTNDLIQYLLAIDRVNEHVSYLYKPLHPAVLRIIKRIIDVAHAAGIRVNMCGEMAGEAFYTPILVGFGIDELSMNALSLLRVKKVIRLISHLDSVQLVDTILRFSTWLEIDAFLRRELSERYGGEIPDLRDPTQ